jgi:hypothetical protein
MSKKVLRRLLGIAVLALVAVACDDAGKNELDGQSGEPDNVVGADADAATQMDTAVDLAGDSLGCPPLCDCMGSCDDADLPEPDVQPDQQAETDSGLTLPLTECPESSPGEDLPCEGSFSCHYGQECCCGECSDSLDCQCGGDAGALFICVYTDACLDPWCEFAPCCWTEEGQGDANAQCESGAQGEDWEGYCLATDGFLGKCVPYQEYPSCWQDAECPDWESCVGASVCPCDADCDGIDTPGTCQWGELPGGCCYEDADCDLGIDMAFTCAFHEGGGPGRCMPAVNGGECWDDGDCAAGSDCQGAQFCICNAECDMIDVPGQCIGPAQPAGQCMLDDQCGATKKCVGEIPCVDAEEGCEPVFGKCQPLPAPGLCWEDYDCGGLDEICINPVYCPAGAFCLFEEHVGVCLSAAAGACWTDADCGPELPTGSKIVCTGEWVIPWWTGNDYDADPDFPGECCIVPPGGCYEDDDCLAGQACVGALYDLGDCTDDGDNEKPGTCVAENPWPEEFCLAEEECGLTQSCIGEWVCPAGEACLDPDYPGLCLDDPVGALLYCYEDSNCPDGFTCQGAYVCDVLEGEMCGGLMASPGVCEETAAPGQVGDPCGQDGGECAAGLVCCYPCGMPDCTWTCAVPCDAAEPWCQDGCPMLP